MRGGQNGGLHFRKYSCQPEGSLTGYGRAPHPIVALLATLTRRSPKLFYDSDIPSYSAPHSLNVIGVAVASDDRTVDPEFHK